MAGSHIWGMSESKKQPPPPELPLGHEEPARKVLGKERLLREASGKDGYPVPHRSSPTEVMY